MEGDPVVVHIAGHSEAVMLLLFISFLYASATLFSHYYSLVGRVDGSSGQFRHHRLLTQPVFLSLMYLSLSARQHDQLNGSVRARAKAYIFLK